MPKVAYDARTVMVPKSVMEDYTVDQIKMVAISIPVKMQRQKWITERPHHLDPAPHD